MPTPSVSMDNRKETIILNAFDRIERGGGRILTRLRKLVAIPSVNPPGERYFEMVSCLQEECIKLGMKAEIHQVPKKVAEAAGVAAEFPRYNLLARWDVGASKTLHFNAHYDVVPAPGSWRYGPFDPCEHKGWLYGRGSGDMKGSIVSLFTAIDAIRKSGVKPVFNIECSLTADEETGGQLGAGYVVNEGLIDADYTVVCEGAAGTRVGLGHNGVLWLQCHVKGKSAHAARPELGRNAFEAMAEIVHGLQRYKDQLSTSSRCYRDVNGKKRYPTVTIGGVFGGVGQKVNTVPGDAMFSLDRRILPNEHLSHVERELRSCISLSAATQPQVRCRVETALRIEPCVTNANLPMPQSFAKSVKVVRRRVAEFHTTNGFTDLHYFVRDAGLPGVGYGVDGDRAHGVDERVRLRDVAQTAKIYSHFMLTGI